MADDGMWQRPKFLQFRQCFGATSWQGMAENPAIFAAIYHIDEAQIHQQIFNNTGADYHLLILDCL